MALATPMMLCATLRPRYGAGMVAQDRFGQDWAARGRLAKFQKHGKIGVV